MHTEEEALKKICPMARNKGTDYLCAGTKCMAWRWAPIDIETEVYGKVPMVRFGYCGAAGKP